MAMGPFLAMTAAEIQNCPELPEKIAWMACHFSPYGTGLSNLPGELPTGSLLILNDRIPIHGHDPQIIARQLEECIGQNNCFSLLLDFQRADCAETAQLITYLSGTLSCPVVVSSAYAAVSGGAVFLPPLPLSSSLAEHIAPWKGRELWMELALDAAAFTVTENGTDIVPRFPFRAPESGHKEEALHCRYHIQITETKAEFTLWRTREDIRELLDDAEKYGIHKTVGLFQELSP